MLEKASIKLAQANLDLSDIGQFGGTTDLRQIIVNVIGWSLVIAGSVAVLLLIAGGFWYITAAGDTGRLEKGKKTVQGAIIGIVIILLSAVIVYTLNSIL